MGSLNRRAFLVLTALLAPVARLRAIAQRTPTSAAEAVAVSLAEFLRLSERLVVRTRLDEQAAAIYLDALRAVPGNGLLLAQLARGTVPPPDLTPAHIALERTIIEWWYTGIYTVHGERRLATHTGSVDVDRARHPGGGLLLGRIWRVVACAPPDRLNDDTDG